MVQTINKRQHNNKVYKMPSFKPYLKYSTMVEDMGHPYYRFIQRVLLLQGIQLIFHTLTDIVS